MAGVGDLKRICTDAFFVAGAVQEASSAEMFGAQGADFLRGVALLFRDRCSISYDLD